MTVLPDSDLFLFTGLSPRINHPVVENLAG